MDNKKVLGFLTIIFACAVWGVAFVPQRTAMEHAGPFTFNAIRFFLAAVMIAVIRMLTGKVFLTKSQLKNGCLLGLVLFLGITCQQIGMIYTTASNGGFITSLYIVLVPLQLSLIWKKKQTAGLWLAVCLALCGLALLSINQEFIINKGDYWIAACAVVFTQHIILIDLLLKTDEPMTLALLQFFVAAFLSAIVAWQFELPLVAGLNHVWPEIFYAGFLSVGLGYTAQLYGQRYVSPMQAAIMFSLEAVFAAMAGWYFLNETLSKQQYVGCLMIFAALILACVKSEANPQIEKAPVH